MKLSKLVSASLIGFCTINMSYAQDKEKENLGEIIITGEMIDRDWLDTTTSINVQSSKELERSNDRTIQDTFRRTSNIISTGAAVQKFDFTIRGVNTGGVGAAGDEGLASIIIDGARSTRVQNARGINSIFDVEQVEVLKGPQSTNIGKNSLAGAVILKTKDPEFEQNTHIRASYGNYDTYQLALANTGPINDELAYRIMIDHNYTDGFVENTVRNEDDYNSDTKVTARAKLLYAPKHLPFDIKITHTKTKSDTSNDIMSYLSEGKFTSLDPYNAQMDVDHDISVLNFNYYLNDAWTIKSTSTYNKFYSDDKNNPFATTIPTDDQVWHAKQDQKEFSQELKFNYESDDLKGVMGFYYSDYTDISSRNGVAVIDMLAPGVHLAINDLVFDEQFETKAIFVEFDYNLMPDLTLSVGGRYEKLDIKNISKGTFVSNPSGFVSANGNLSDEKNQKIFLPKLGLNYALDDNQRVGFVYSEGYRAGGISLDLAPILAAQPSAISKFDSEHTKNYELSYKGFFKEQGLNLSSNLFYVNWKDMQTVAGAGLGQPTVNAGKASVKGIEFEAQWKPSEKIDTFVSMAYTKTKFDELNTGGQDWTGNEFIKAPRLTASAGAYYSMNKFTYGTEVSYQGGYYDSIQNNYKVSSLTVINASANYEIRNNLNLKLFANNIFDKVIQLRKETNTESENLTLHSAPRTFGFMIDYKF